MIQVFQAQFPPQNTPLVDDNDTITTSWMAFFRALFGRTGLGTGLPNQVNDNVTTTGQLTADWNYVPSGPALASVDLPPLTGGQMIMVHNASGFALTINAPAGATIDGIGSYSIPTGKMQVFWFLSSTQIISTQLG